MTVSVDALIARLSEPPGDEWQLAYFQLSTSNDPDLLPKLAAKATPRHPDIERVFCKYLQNLPYKTAMPRFADLLKSGNEHTRLMTLQALGQIPFSRRAKLTVAALQLDCPKCQLFALKEVAKHSVTTADRAVPKLIYSDDIKVMEAAFHTLQKLDTPACRKALEHCLETAAPSLRRHAIKVLGRMPGFATWTAFTPFLSLPDTDLCKEAIEGVFLKGGPKGMALLLNLLPAQQSVATGKKIISQLIKRPSRGVVSSLLQTALSHPLIGLRLWAESALHHLDSVSLYSQLLGLLPQAAPAMKAFILTHLAQQRFSGCGVTLAAALGPKESRQVRYAALEGLALVKDPAFLSSVRPFIQSDDPLESYLAVCAAVAMGCPLDESGDLATLLMSDAPGDTLKRQVILQAMAEGRLVWTLPDKTLWRIVSDQANSVHRGLQVSVIQLMKVFPLPKVAGALLRFCLDEHPGCVRREALNSLNALLAGNISPLLPMLDATGLAQDSAEPMLAFLVQLDWSGSPVMELLYLVAQWADAHPLPEQLLLRSAEKLLAAQPQTVQSWFVTQAGSGPFKAAVGRSWLAAIEDFEDADAQRDLSALILHAPEPELPLVLTATVRRKAKWSFRVVMQRLRHCEDRTLQSHMRAAAKTLLDL